MSRVEVSVQWKDDAWRKAALPSLNAGLTAAALEMRDESWRNLTAKQSPPTSRPGEIPHRDTGNLSDNLRAVSPEGLGTPLHAAFGTKVIYGRDLELGRVTVAARPWIVRSAYSAKAKAVSGFKSVVSKGLKAAGLSM